MQLQINAVPNFWKDVKSLYKHLKRKEFTPVFDGNDFYDLDDERRANSIPYIKALTTSIINCYPNIDSTCDKYDRQPFLTNGWTIWKFRYALDNTGKSNGTRLIFCINTNNILLVYINTKSRCSNERELEREFMPRIKEYILP